MPSHEKDSDCTMVQKQNTRWPFALHAGAAFCLLAPLAGSAGAQGSRAVRLDAGSVIPVRLNDTLSSLDSRKGQTFTATIRGESTQSDVTILPSGTTVDGVVKGVRSQQGKDPGVLDVAFRRVHLPDGRSFAIDGSLIGLDNKSVDRRSDGSLVAKPAHKNDRLTYVGYGAGAGLIVGLLTKHTLEDAVIGGGLGYLFGSLQKGHSDARDVNLKAGTELGVRLDSSVSTSAYSDQYGTSEGTTGRFHRTDAPARDLGRPLVPPSDLNTGVMIGDQTVNFDSTAMPVVIKGVTMIPAVPVLRSARIPYTWDASRQVLSATGDNGPARIAVGSRIAVLRGSQRSRLDAPAQRLNGTIYVPARFLELATGYKMQFDAGSRTFLYEPNGALRQSDDQFSR